MSGDSDSESSSSPIIPAKKSKRGEENEEKKGKSSIVQFNPEVEIKKLKNGGEVDNGADDDDEDDGDVIEKGVIKDEEEEVSEDEEEGGPDVIEEFVPESDSEDEQDVPQDSEDENSESESRVGGSSQSGMGSREEGELDLSVYTLMRRLKLPWPCLTLDAFHHFGPKQQTQSPFDIAFVAASQAPYTKEEDPNQIYVFKTRSHVLRSTLPKMDEDEASSSSEDSESEDEEASSKKGEAAVSVVPKQSILQKRSSTLTSGGYQRQNSMHCIGIPFSGACNRIRQTCMKGVSTHTIKSTSGSSQKQQQQSKDKSKTSDEEELGQQQVVAAWSELGHISIFDVTDLLTSLNSAKSQFEVADKRPFCAYNGHGNVEGFGLDWSPVVTYQGASGDVKGNIHIWKVQSNSKKATQITTTQTRSKNSIEDIQWSPAEESVLATCETFSSKDGSALRVWDSRLFEKPMLGIKDAHGDKDINVIAWNPFGEPFIVSGGDDCKLKVWDLRQLGGGSTPSPVAQFSYHSAPITSVRWNPLESTQFAASSEDNAISVWDLSLEREIVSSTKKGENESGENEDDDEEREEAENEEDDDDIPAQLLFLHEGQQQHVKEVTWHSGVKNMLLSTASDCLNMFMPYNL